jgi:multiple antibiotic resistance protein
MPLEDWAVYAKFFTALLAIVNPFGIIPVFINLTSDLGERKRNRTCRVVAVSTMIILCVALILGETILRFFGISMASFKVGGGILILIMAISMLHARMSSVKQTEEEAIDSEEKEAVAVVPLGTPLLAGPGAISTVILYGQKYNSITHTSIFIFEIFLLALITWLSFRSANTIESILGRTGINVVTRIMGLFMAAVGVEFIANGLKQLFPVLG